MPSTKVNLSILATPEDFDVAIVDFDAVNTVVETEQRILNGELRGRSGDHLLLIDKWSNELEIPFKVDAPSLFNDFRVEGLEVPQSATSFTNTIPLSWINCLVLVQLKHGAVTGLLSDSFIGDSDNLHILPLFGRPVVPPLPIHTVMGVTLVPRAFCFHQFLSTDQTCVVYKYLLQRYDHIAVRECHVNAAVGIDVLLSLPCEFGEVDLDQEYVYHMKYERVSEHDPHEVPLATFFVKHTHVRLHRGCSGPSPMCTCRLRLGCRTSMRFGTLRRTGLTKQTRPCQCLSCFDAFF